MEDFELLIIDGGSTDGTVNILEKYSKNDKRIKFISEKDEGIYDAMNKGILQARGQWLYFMGSDDVLYDNQVLLRVADVLRDCSCDFLYGNVLMGDSKAKYAGHFTMKKLLRMNISHQAIFYKSGIFERKGSYNTRFRLHADWDFNIRCFESPDIHIRYADILVARFGQGGVSANHDIPFLREVIIPMRAKELSDNEENLGNIRIYDEWWRLIRNAGVQKPADLQSYIGEKSLPRVLAKIVSFQQHIPQKLLRTGVVSKLLMSIHFCFSGNKKRY